MSKIKGELEDLSFKYILPEQYHAIVVGLDKKKDERELYLNQIKQDLESRIKKVGVKADISGRSKHIYSIYKKMQRDSLTLNQIFDIFALRIIVNTVSECYTALGVIHEAYKPMPGKFKDYIAVPKENMYQSIHTTLVGKNAPPFEIQIRTHEMHEIAENGIAAHWAYKEANYKSKGKKNVKAKQDKLSWLKQTLEWQEDVKDPEEFMQALKTDLFEDEVYVFTPKGHIKSFPKDSIAIDFAYAIHEEIGNRMIGCKINTRIMPISTKLQTGDIVEIITSDNSKGPSRDWISMVKSPSAKTRITQWFKRKDREKNIEKGKLILEKELEKLKLNPSLLMKKEWIQAAVEHNKFNNEDDMFATVGFGTISPKKVLTKLINELKEIDKDIDVEKKLEKLRDRPSIEKTSNKQVSGIIVEGLENFLVTFAKCCSPLPGEQIIGYVSRGRGVTIHRNDCPNIIRMMKDEERIVEVKWAHQLQDKYTVDIEIFALDRKELLKDMIKVIEKNKINLLGLRAESKKDNIALVGMRVEIASTEELESLMTSLNAIENVFEVRRKKR